MSQKIAFAVKCSIAVLQSLETEEPSEFSIQKTPSLPLRGSLYLWTFTTPDQNTLEILSKRWTAFTKRLRNMKLDVKWMRFFEPHKSEHGWHVHCVAVTRYDVSMIRPLAEKFGFGRLNVVRIPASKIGYVLKYVTKYRRQASDGKFRLWACNGFKGVTTSKVRIYDSWADYCFATVGYSELSKYSIDYIWRAGLERWSMQSALESAKTKQPMNEKQNAKALELLAKGALVVYVEYRGQKIREARKFIDGRASLSEKSYYISYLLEAGATSLLVEEAMPDSYRPGDVVVARAEKGQTALLEVTKVAVFNGKTTFNGVLHCIT